jgi:lauroyl/myristoyl acyltransferase
MADHALYWLALGLIRLIQLLPLTWAARLGRGLGQLAYYLDARHRRVAQRNLEATFGTTLGAPQVQALAQENFKRIGEAYCSGVKTSAMKPEEISRCLEFTGVEALQALHREQPMCSAVGAIGHFGNFEIYAHMGRFVAGFHPAATFRGLRQPGLDRLLGKLRATSGCTFYERRSGAAALKAALNQGGVLLGLLADQHGGDGGIALPFLNRTCSTNPAPAVLALRYRAPLFVAICYRIGLGRWKVEVSPFIPTHIDGRARPVEDIMREVNVQFEKAIHRDPANWFWVHNRWKPMKPRRGAITAPSPANPPPQEPSAG